MSCPLLNFSNDGLEDYFCSGLGEDLSTQLARIQGLSVIAYYSALKYTGPNLDLRQVGKELGVEYIVTGSVRKSRDCVRLAVQLNESRTRQQIWGHKYDFTSPTTELYPIQDEITHAIISGVEDYYGCVARTVWKASRRKPVKALSAYEATLRFHYYDAI